MSVINKFDTNSNFWKMNPQFKILEPFKSLYIKDKTAGKKYTSKVMWAVAFLLDPSKDNIYRNVPTDERKELICRDFLGYSVSKFDKYQNIMDFYKKQVLSQAAKSLLVWEDIMTDREKTLKGMYKEALKNKDIDLIVELDKLLATTPKYYMDYDKIKKTFLEEEESNNRGKGNRVKSLTDTGEI